VRIQYHGHASECKRGRTRGREEEIETLKYLFLGILFGGVSPTSPIAFYTNYRGHAFEIIVVILLSTREGEREGKGKEMET